MFQIRREPVADVDHRAGSGGGQNRCRRKLGLRTNLATDQQVTGQGAETGHFDPVQQGEAGSGTTDGAGYRDYVSGPGAGAAGNGGLVVDMGDHRDAEKDGGRTDHVTTGEVDPELFGSGDNPVGESFQIGGLGSGGRSEGDQHFRIGPAQTHRRQVGDGACNRLPGNLGGGPAGSEMNSGYGRINGGDDSSPGPDHRRVITDSGLEPTRLRSLRRDPPDQFELAQVHGSDTIADQMSEEPRSNSEGAEKASLLHRLGHLAATVGKTGPKKKSTKIILQGSVAFLIFGFLVFTVVTQWSELKEKGVEFDFIWLIPAVVMMMLYYIGGAAVWGLILRFMGSPVPAMETQKIWAQPLLVRYIPGTVLFLLARILMAEKVGVQRRVTTAGIVYEQAVSIAGALTIASWFLIDHPELQGQPARWLPLLILPAMVLLLHPRIFGPVSKRLLHALGRESLPQLMPFRGVVTVYLAYVVVWAIMGIGVFFAARAVHHLNLDDLAIVAASQMIGFLAAVVSAVTPAGLGVRDAAFAWAVKVALPSDSFGVGAVIAIAVRATQTVVELFYVGGVTLLTRKEGDEGEIELAEEAAEEAAVLESSRG